MKKKNINRLISWILTLIMCVSSAPMTALAESSEPMTALAESSVPVTALEAGPTDAQTGALTMSKSGGKLNVDYSGDREQALIIVAAYDRNGKAVSFDSSVVSRNNRAVFDCDSEYIYKSYALEPDTYKPICDAQTETITHEGEAPIPFLEDDVAEAMTTAISAYLTASDKLDEVMAVDISGIRSDQTRTKQISAQLEEAAQAYEQVFEAGAVLGKVAQSAADSASKDMAALLASQEGADPDIEELGMTQDEQIHWAEELTKKYDSIQGNMKCKALGEMMGCDARRAYQQLCMAQNILTGHYYDEEAEAMDAWAKGFTVLKGACKVGLFVGATVLTLGTSAAVSGAAYGTVTVGEAVGITIGGVDTTVEIMNDTAVLVCGRDKHFEQVVEKRTKPISEMCFIYSVATGGGSSVGEKIACLGDIDQHLSDYGVYKSTGSVLEQLVVDPLGNTVKFGSSTIGTGALISKFDEKILTEEEQKTQLKEETQAFTAARPVAEEKLEKLLKDGGDLEEGETLKTVTEEFKDTVSKKVAREDGQTYVHEKANGKEYIYTIGENGYTTGLYQVYDSATGQLLEEYYYDKDGTPMGEKAKSGVIPYYDSEGRLIREEAFDEGKLVWIKTYDPATGNLTKQTEYDGNGNWVSTHEWSYDSKTGRLAGEREFSDGPNDELKLCKRTEYYLTAEAAENTIDVLSYSLYWDRHNGDFWYAYDYYDLPWYFYYEDGNIYKIRTGAGRNWLKEEYYSKTGWRSWTNEYTEWSETVRKRKVTNYFDEDEAGEKDQIEKIRYYRSTNEDDWKETEWYEKPWVLYNAAGVLLEETSGTDDFWTQKLGYDDKGTLSYDITHDALDKSITEKHYYTVQPTELPFAPLGHMSRTETRDADGQATMSKEWFATTWFEEEKYADDEGKTQTRKYKVWGYLYNDYIEKEEEKQEEGRVLVSDTGNTEASLGNSGLTTEICHIDMPICAAGADDNPIEIRELTYDGAVCDNDADPYEEDYIVNLMDGDALPVLEANEKGIYTYEFTGGTAGKRYVIFAVKGRLDTFPGTNEEVMTKLLYMDQKTVTSSDRLFNIIPKSGYEATLFISGDTLGSPVPVAYLAENHNAAANLDDDDEEELPYECEPGDNPYENDPNVKYLHGMWISGDIDSSVYTGKPVTISPRVYFRSKRLVENVDYTISYQRNTNAYALNETDKGYDEKVSPVATFILKGNYTGSGSMPFKILPRDIGEEGFEISPLYASYTGSPLKPGPMIRWNGTLLKYGTDYIVREYENGTADLTGKSAGTAVIPLTIEGTGNFKGTRTISLTILGSKVSDEADALPLVMMDKVKVSAVPDQTYDGTDIEYATLKDKKGRPFVPVVTYNGKELKEGEDYTAKLADNRTAGTARLILTGLCARTSETGSSFAGEKTVNFKIKGIPMSKVTVSGISKAGYTYAGIPVKPDELSDITLTYKKSKTEIVELVRDRDYTISYEKNDRSGKGNLVCTGLSGFTGSKKTSFKINPASIESDSFAVKIEEVNPYQKGGTKPAVTVTDRLSGQTLTEGTDYTLSYSNATKLYTSADLDAKKKGQPVVTVKGKGNYKGKRTANYLITARSLKSGMRIMIGDVAYSGKAGLSKVNIFALDRLTGMQLKAGTDYEKTVEYTYWSDTTVSRKGKGAGDILRKEGEKVDKNDILKEGTVIEATITGKGGFTDSIQTTFTVIAPSADISKGTFAIADQEFEVTPVTITDMSQFKTDKSGNVISYVKVGKEQRTLVLGTDFKVVPGSYINNRNLGTATVTLYGTGDFGGLKTVTFKVVPKKMYWQGYHKKY